MKEKVDQVASGQNGALFKEPSAYSLKAFLGGNDVVETVYVFATSLE
jgi:hypothetical protein